MVGVIVVELGGEERAYSSESGPPAAAAGAVVFLRDLVLVFAELVVFDLGRLLGSGFLFGLEVFCFC